MAVGRWRTMRRTEATTWAPILSSRSRRPGHLGASTGGPRRAQPEFLHQHIGRGGEEDAQLIRPEATAAGPTDLEPVVQLFDPILDVTAGTVDPLVNEPRRLPQIGDDRSAGCPAARGRRAGRPRL